MATEVTDKEFSASASCQMRMCSSIIICYSKSLIGLCQSKCDSVSVLATFGNNIVISQLLRTENPYI
jgi:hypothetical protein